MSNFTLAQTKTILSWLVAFLGLAVCEYRLILAGVDEVDGAHWDYLLAGTIHVLGPGVFGLLALRDRRWAALCFLASAPIVAFVMAYPAAAIWGTYGYYLPNLWLALGLAALFFAPLVLVAFTISRWTFYAFLVWAIAATAIFFFSDWTAPLLRPLFAWSASYLVFGAFWLVTARLGWPRLQASWPKSRGRRVVLACTLLLVAIAVDVAGTLAWVASHSSTWRPDCSGYRLPTTPFNSSHAVFTARVIRTGHSVRALGKWGASWAIGVVKQRYWGVPSWKPQFVLLTGSWFVEDETFLVSGYRAEGLLTRFLPIVSTQYCAVGAMPIADAEIPLRLLNDPSTPVQIIGQVRSPKRIAPALAYNDLSRAFDPSQRPYVPLAGVRVRISGRSRTVIVTTDRSGIYSVSGLPVDDYWLSVLDVPENQVSVERKYENEAFLDGPRAHDVPLYLGWDGVFGGTVTNEAGRPMAIWVKMLRPDGSEAGEIPRAIDFAGEHGSFQFVSLPFRGRYILQINPPGPISDSRYPSVYYPFALRPEDAHIFEVVDRKSVSTPVKLILRRVTRGDPAR